jgi:hypothetical protein
MQQWQDLRQQAQDAMHARLRELNDAITQTREDAKKTIEHFSAEVIELRKALGGSVEPGRRPKHRARSGQSHSTESGTLLQVLAFAAASPDGVLASEVKQATHPIQTGGLILSACRHVYGFLTASPAGPPHHRRTLRYRITEKGRDHLAAHHVPVPEEFSRVQ